MVQNPDRRPKLNKIRFTMEDLNNKILNAMKEPQPQGKPNLLQLLRTKKEQKKVNGR